MTRSTSALVLASFLAVLGSSRDVLAAPIARIALVNLGHPGSTGWEQALGIAHTLGERNPGWASQRAVIEALAAVPNGAALPAADGARELGPLLGRIRSGGRPSDGDLWRLGELLSVDYLLLIRVGGRTATLRLYSIRKQRFSPSGLAMEPGRRAPLSAYLRSQLRALAPSTPQNVASSRRRYWIWAVAGAAVLGSVVLALVQQDDGSGALRIRVSR